MKMIFRNYMKKIQCFLVGLLAFSSAFAQVNDEQLTKMIEELRSNKSFVEKMVSESGLKKNKSKEIYRRNITHLFASDRFISEMRIFTQAFRKNQGRLPNEKESELIGNMIGARMLNDGIRKLQTDQIKSYLQFNKIMLSSMNNTECVRFLMRTSTDIDGVGRSVFEIAEGMGDDAFRTYMDISLEAMRRSIEGDAQIVLPNVERVRNINRSYVQQLIQKIRTEKLEDTFEKFMLNGGRFDTDESVGCSIGRVLISTLMEMPKEDAGEAIVLFVNDRLFKN
jgi:hypothetical protein